MLRFEKWSRDYILNKYLNGLDNVQISPTKPIYTVLGMRHKHWEITVAMDTLISVEPSGHIHKQLILFLPPQVRLTFPNENSFCFSLLRSPLLITQSCINQPVSFTFSVPFEIFEIFETALKYLNEGSFILYC